MPYREEKSLRHVAAVPTDFWTSTIKPWACKCGRKNEKNWLVHVVWSLKVRIVSELTKAPTFLQLIAYCSSMNIIRGAQCRYFNDACKTLIDFCKFDLLGTLSCFDWKLLFHTLNHSECSSHVVNNNFTRKSTIPIHY